jgi:serine/threonine-protein kinase HipA
LKFDASETGENARFEYGYALMARAAGIRMTECHLLAESPDEPRRHLLVRRFDVPAGADPRRRLHFHSASGLLHREPDTLDYRDLFRTAIRLNLDRGELGELARRMIFNVLTSNHDDHGKNHAFLLDEATGRWVLTPAYDLTYSGGMVQRGTQIAGEVWPEVATMEAGALGGDKLADGAESAGEGGFFWGGGVLWMARSWRCGFSGDWHWYRRRANIDWRGTTREMSKIKI